MTGRWKIKRIVTAERCLLAFSHALGFSNFDGEKRSALFVLEPERAIDAFHVFLQMVAQGIAHFVLGFAAGPNKLGRPFDQVQGLDAGHHRHFRHCGHFRHRGHRAPNRWKIKRFRRGRLHGQSRHGAAQVVYRLLSVRWQARIDLILYIIFFFPGMLALLWYGWEIASDSWRYKEVSWNSPARIQIYFFKTLIPMAGALFIIQGTAECMRCYLAIKENKWLPRLKDAQETEDLLQAQAAKAEAQ